MTPSNPDRHERDAFPTTQVTWLGRALLAGESGQGEAAQHVMSVYAHPLHVYLKGSSFRDLGEPDEIVDGFFASRLSRNHYLLDWLASGRQLRYWLLTGFRHYLYEQIEAQRRHQRPREAGPPEPPLEAEQAFHREAALAIVREAYRRAEAACTAAEQSDHWRVFREHHVRERAYGPIAQELGIDERRTAVMARTAAGKFRRALRELVSWPKAVADEVDQELRDLMEAVQR
ncbi:MAG: hypothetical protein ACYSWT_15980 [Planctomycetota bacterium]|jgi:DNA-directed RNA polymerase specialized sigma24 family protein